MATYEYNDKVKFVLPAGFMLEREENDEGEEVVKILAGEYEDDEGDTCYSFQCQITELKYDPDDMDEDDITSENQFDKVTDRMEDAKKVKVADIPETYFMSKAIPLQIFGRVMKMFVAITIVKTSDWGGINILSSNRFNDDDPDENATICKNVFEVLKAVRVDGKKIPLENISPEIIQDIIESSFDFDSEAIDVSPTIKLNITTGNETRTLEYTSDGMKEVGMESLTIVEPDEELYPHYQSIKSAGGFGLFGANVVVNASGTEYSFEPLSKYANSDSDNYEMKEVFERIVAKDTAYYDLHDKAKEMQSLFHVNEEVFDSRHDRECELEEGLMHRAYMMSGLRSFAWTLADYCANHDNCEPEDIDSGIAKRIANFVAHQDWLNYDDTTYCTGLCAGSDLHVYFIPDSVSQADRKKLLPSDEDIERVKDMKAKFPSYREILCEVHSLDDLREDLEYIYPAVRMLWEELEEERDYDEPLTGNEADIVYAWCALALAAKGPFFTEDGPTSCFFDQIGGNGSTSYYDSYDNHNQALSIIGTKYPKSTATTTSATSTTPVTSATPKETPAPKTTSVPASSSSSTIVSKTVATPVKEQPSVTKTEVSSTVSSAAKKEKPKAKKTNKAKAIAIAVALSVVAIAVFIILLINVIVPNAKYNKAMSLVSDGRYEEALLIFEELDGHKDSVNQIKTTRALQREATLNSSKYSFLSNLKIGDTFKFGEIEQDNNTNNGAEEIEWIVLDKKDGEILVISKYCIYAHVYNATVGESYDVTWSNSDMRAWLNGEFYKQLFSSNEQSLLNETKISSDSDLLFLLSVEEAEKYFDDDESRKTTATPYAKTFGYDFGVNGWRLRSNGGYYYNPSNVTESGEIDVDGYGHDSLMGVRPAMWIAVE